MNDELDVTIAQIRQVRHRISERLGHDPRRVIAYYMELQQLYAERILPAEAETSPDQNASALERADQPVLIL